MWQEPLLQELLRASHLPWQVRLGGVLALACSPNVPQHPENKSFRFWRRYSLLLPSAEDQTSLMFFSPEELMALQDGEMEEAGRKKQAEVGLRRRLRLPACPDPPDDPPDPT